MQRTVEKRLLVLLIVPFLTLACQQAEPEPEAPATEEPAAEARVTPSFAQYNDRANEIIAQMTLAEKVGQMTQPAIEYLEDPSDIATYFLGSVLSGGNSDPPNGNSFEDWHAMVEGFNAEARKTRLGIPLIYGVDAVHGHSNVIGATIFPHNIGLGATRDADLVERIFRATAVEVRATGIQWNFAPAVTIPRDDRWGRTYEGFSEDPEVANELGGAAVRGMQGKGLSDPTSIAACAKHFAGDGGTVWGTGMESAEGVKYPLDRGDVQLDEETFRKIHVASYKAALAEGVATIMPSYSSWNGEKCSGSKELLTDMLKDELGFDGFLISDWMAINELPGEYDEDVAQAINAGMDMVMVPDDYKLFISTLKQVVEDGRVPMERIDDAVRRILRVKIAMGMLDDDYDHVADPALADKVGSPEHRAIAREAVQKSLVVLENDGALPLAKDATRIHVAGRAADDVGRQCGGWTIAWQGEVGDVTEGTTILEGLREVAGDGVEITYSEDGSGAEGADAIVVVIGEDPYAEFMGDDEDIALHPDDAAAVARAAATGAPVVTVLVSGRPLILGETLEQSNAFVAAWLPGTEGQGVADVLFGDVKPSGKLTFSWPRSIDQVVVNRGDADYDPLFPYDHGLTY